MWREGRKEGKKGGREVLQFVYPAFHLLVQQVLMEHQLSAGADSTGSCPQGADSLVSEQL